MVGVDPPPPPHGIMHALGVVGSVAPVSTGALGLPLSPSSLPLEAAPVSLVEQTSLGVSEDELCSPSDLDDERLSPEALPHIAYEVVSELDRVEDF
jgi:hypothetical protein